ncbi:hypothetical protein B0H17DRAFT_1070100 [Mycena rosella]|uniref:Uncharacterized protein n=1 Tax=Mycena rosella TaxID=1033263 RepID=A0AAD7DBL5_MYCRO|nr:hypothetical protein B0H17DRAFT_1070100 [Mycena rosella]
MSAPTSTPTTPAADESTASSLLRRIPTQKIASFIRLKTQRPTKPPPIIFPPPSWSLDETQNNGAGASDLPDEPGIPRNLSEDKVTKEETPEPHAFAQRIRTLIDSLPLPAPTKDADVGAVDPKGPPLPLSVTADSKLMKLLCSESVMNGSRALGRQSVWSMLERLKHGSGATGGPTIGDEGHGDEREDEGVMMYAPLEPDAESQVELADSETVLEYLDEPAEPDKLDPSTPAPLDTKPAPSPPSAGKRTGVKPSKSRRKRTVQERTRWVPSPTQISLQAMWWGYRLYLPPPVMKVLDNTHLAAAKRGVMITTALKYLLDKVPLLLLPPQIRPAMMVLKRLTPYLGYVGVFIAWSWTAIKARDKGDGVVLTATWLLPVALVPATLKPSDFQRQPGGAKDVKATSPKTDSTPPAKPDSAPATGVSDSNKSTEPDLKPEAAQTGGASATKPDTDAEAPPSKRWSSFFLKREKSQGKADEQK